MSDQEFTAAPSDDSGKTPAGAILTAERERHQLSIEDVSAQLRLSPRQIMALENDEYSALPEAMITRGYIRNYARFLQIDPEPLLRSYRNHAASAEHYAISIPSANIPITRKTSRTWKPYFFVSLAIIVLLGLWVIYVDYLPDNLKPQSFSPTLGSLGESADEQTVDTPAVLPPAPTPVMPDATSAPGSDNGVSPGTSDASSASSTSAQSEPTQAEPAVPTLRLAFNEESWVSVTDSTNTEILNKTKPAGSEEILEGRPPFKIVIGNATGAELFYNGQEVDLAPYTRLNVARVTLE